MNPLKKTTDKSTEKSAFLKMASEWFKELLDTPSMLLLKAAKKGNLKTVQKALSLGASPGDYGHNGTPIIYTLCIEAGEKIGDPVRFSMIKYLINQCPACIQATTDTGRAVVYAIESSAGLSQPQKYELLDLIFKKCLTPVVSTYTKNTLLHLRLNIDFLKFLIKYKPNPLLRNKDGLTPLMLQIKFSEARNKRLNDFLSNEETIKEILRKSADDELIQILDFYENIYRARIMSVLIECIRDAIAISEQIKADKDVIKLIGAYMDLDFQSSYNEIGHLSEAEMDAFTTSDNPIVFYRSLALERDKASKKDHAKIKFTPYSSNPNSPD